MQADSRSLPHAQTASRRSRSRTSACVRRLVLALRRGRSLPRALSLRPALIRAHTDSFPPVRPAVERMKDLGRRVLVEQGVPEREQRCVAALSVQSSLSLSRASEGLTTVCRSLSAGWASTSRRERLLSTRPSPSLSTVLTLCLDMVDRRLYSFFSVRPSPLRILPSLVPEPDLSSPSSSCRSTTFTCTCSRSRYPSPARSSAGPRALRRRRASASRV